MKSKTLNKLTVQKNSTLRGWFYTNERLEKLLLQKRYFKNTKNIFCIGAGGDFAFSFLSLYGDKVTEIQTCDNRTISSVTQDLKAAIIKCLEYTGTNRTLSEVSLRDTDVLKNVLLQTEVQTQTIIKDLLKKKTNKATLTQVLKRSKLWQSDSFWQIKKTEEYLGYLTTEKRYCTLQKNLPKLKQNKGDFFTVLEDFPDGYFDVIYTSNIFDSPKFHNDPQQYLQKVHKKLSNKGKFISCNIKKQKKMNRAVISSGGFALLYKEIHSFSFLSALQGHYDYSYFVYKKITTQSVTP